MRGFGQIADALRDRAAAHRRDHRRRPRPPRARRIGRRRRAVEGGARRGSARGRDRRRARRSADLEPHLAGRTSTCAGSAAGRRRAARRTARTSRSAERPRSGSHSRRATRRRTAHRADAPTRRSDSRSSAPEEVRRRAALAWRGEELPLPGGGFVDQRRLQREPDLDAAPRSGTWPSAGGPPPRRRSSAAMAELGTTPRGTTGRSRSSQPSSAIEVLAVGERRARLLGGRTAVGRRMRTPPLAARSRQLVRPGDAVLVKASRSVALEGIAPALANTRRNGPSLHSRPRSRWSSPSSIGPKFIEYLRRNEMGQPIREDGPAGHVVKQGTPVMGGLLILLCALDPVPRALEVHAACADRALHDGRAAAAVGFLDDFIKVRHRRSLGLQGRWKLILLARDHGRASASPSTRRASSTPRSTSRSLERRRPALVRLLPLPLPRHRRRGERRQPDGRPRRARRRHRDHRSLHVPGDQRDRATSARATRVCATTSRSTSRCWRRR